VSPDPTSLDRLHDLVLAPPVPWWPPAPGWRWLIGFAVCVLVGLAARAVSRRRANLYRREALALLAAPSAPIASLPELVKRTALSAYPRETVASLTGDAWLAFLDRTGNTKAFTRGPGRRLVDLAYTPQVAIPQSERAELVATVRQWIERHSTDAR
jgi:hypothetical protein